MKTVHAFTKAMVIVAALMLVCGGVSIADLPPATTVASTANITSAVTTVVISATNHPTLVYWLGEESSGTNTSATFYFEYSPNASCSSVNTLLTPFPQTAGSAAGQIVATYTSGMGNAAQQGALSPGSVPFILPANDYLCIVTAGSAVSLYGIALYA